ncbi:hypothetical protein ACWIGM_03755 [Bosea sp. NPDC055332]
MAKLGLFYRGRVDNEHIFTTVYDGASWTGDTSISSQPGGIDPRTWDPPAACLYNNDLYLVYGSRDGNDIYMSVYSGSTWYGDEMIGSVTGESSPKTSRGPRLVVYDDTLYLIYVRPGDNVLCRSWFDGWRWQGSDPIVTSSGSTLKSDKAPAAVVFNGKLYLIYRGANVRSSKLYVAWFDGQNWSGDTAIVDQPGHVDPWSDDGPSAAVFNNQLVLAYKGDTTPDLYIARFDGTNWSGDVKLSDEPGGPGAQSEAGPSLQVCDGKLWLVYCGYRNRSFFVSWFDGRTWSGDVRISSQAGNVDPESDAGPALALMPFPVPVVDGFPPPQIMNVRTKPMPNTDAPAVKTGARVEAKTVVAIAAAPEDPSLANPETPICDISLMGSHDSAAINPKGWGFYACQVLTITQQLDAGVRVLDVRLKVKTSSSGYQFATCHGNRKPESWPTLNEYQTFESLLTECRNFLDRRPTQFLVMSLKIDDWNNINSNEVGPAVYDALRAMLGGGYFVVGRSDIPRLREVQGKIYLINRINSDSTLGVPIAFPDNPKGQWLAHTDYCKFDVFLQDRYEDLQQYDPNAEKLELFMAAARARQKRGQVVINFGSGTRVSIFGVDIKRILLKHLGTVANRPDFFGWTLFDFIGTSYPCDPYSSLSCADMIYAANTGYSRFPNAYDLVHDGL